MKQPFLILLGLVLAGSAPAQNATGKLTESERLTLIDQLESLRDEAQSHAKERFDNARSAFLEAIESNDAVIDLYLRCVEKVDFEARDRKASDFREWRSRNRDRLRDEGFAMALRHQLRWTILTMRAATDPGKIHQLAPDALENLEAIYANPHIVRNHVGVLAQGVNGTVFARAYGLEDDEIPNWPLAPLQGQGGDIRVEPPFEQLIFPALRDDEEPAALREAWERRIHFEEVARGFWSGEGEDDRGEGWSRARDQFLTETHPKLLWQKEVDLFKAGDQRTAALNMLNHLKANLGHSDARTWEQEFRNLIDPEPASASTE